MSHSNYSDPSRAVEAASRLLANRCPASAHAYALAMHEIAAWAYDDEMTEHWRKVLTLLRKEQQLPVWFGRRITTIPTRAVQHGSRRVVPEVAGNPF
jgi:hypothetical protein